MILRLALALLLLAVASPASAAVVVTRPGTTCAADPRLQTPVQGQDFCFDSTTNLLYAWSGSWTAISGGSVTGTCVTANRLAKFTGASAVGCSAITDIAGALTGITTLTASGLATLNAGAIVAHDQYYESFTNNGVTVKTLLGINTNDPNKTQLGNNVITLGQDLPIRFGTSAPVPILLGRVLGGRYSTYNPGAAQITISGDWRPSQTDINFGGSPGDLNVIGLNVQPTIYAPAGWSTGSNTLAMVAQYFSAAFQSATTGIHRFFGGFFDMPPITLNGAATAEITAALYAENIYPTPVTGTGPWGELLRYVIYQANSGNPNRFDDLSYFNAGLRVSSKVIFASAGPHHIGDPTLGTFPGLSVDRHAIVLTGAFAPTQTDTVFGGNGYNIGLLLDPTITAPPGSGATNSSLFAGYGAPALVTDGAGSHAVFGTLGLDAPVVTEVGGVKPDYIATLVVANGRSDAVNVDRFALWVQSGKTRIDGTVNVGGTPAVTCTAGTVNAATMTVSNGFVTHC